MMANKETELTSAIMVYAIRCLAEGDQSALRNMNFGPREVAVLREMNLGDMCNIDAMRAHCLRVALDRDVYWSMVQRLRKYRETEELQKVLISADAPQDMMHELYFMNGREYTRLRRMLLVESINGRPPEPNEPDTQNLWDVWKQHIKGREDEPLLGEDYLAIHEASGIGLRTVWGQISRWAEYGQLPAVGNGN